MRRLMGICVLTALVVALSGVQAGASLFLNPPVDGAESSISDFGWGQ